MTLGNEQDCSLLLSTTHCSCSKIQLPVYTHTLALVKDLLFKLCLKTSVENPNQLYIYDFSPYPFPAASTGMHRLKFYYQ